MQALSESHWMWLFDICVAYNCRLMLCSDEWICHISTTIPMNSHAYIYLYIYICLVAIPWNVLWISCKIIEYFCYFLLFDTLSSSFQFYTYVYACVIVEKTKFHNNKICKKIFFRKMRLLKSSAKFQLCCYVSNEQRHYIKISFAFRSSNQHKYIDEFGNVRTLADSNGQLWTTKKNKIKS